MKKRFTYGDQFSPDKFSLSELLALCNDFGNDRRALQAHIASTFFHTSGSSSSTMAMNTMLSLQAYGLIDMSGDHYTLTTLADELKALSTEEDKNDMFAVHILTNLDGITLIKVVENLKSRGEQVTLENIGDELNEIGIEISPSSTYVSTMKAWLSKAGVFKSGRTYDVDWSRVKALLRIDKSLIDELYSIPSVQKFFLKALINLDAREPVLSNNVAEYVRSVYKLRVTRKNLVKNVIEPLEEAGLIESFKSTEGRGAKPHYVKLTSKVIGEVVEPLIEGISKLTGISSAMLNQSFETVIGKLGSDDIHEKGIALELLAVWLIRLLNLKFTGWRMRSREATGGGEVDVMAANDKIIYNRWQIQCKNTSSSIGVDVIAKEVGMTFQTGADIIMVVTTSGFSEDAIHFANKVMHQSRYYVILLDGNDIKVVSADRTKIVELLNQKAEAVFMFKEGTPGES